MYEFAEHIVALAPRTDWFFLTAIAAQEIQDTAARSLISHLSTS
jgi:hypothetical protein